MTTATDHMKELIHGNTECALDLYHSLRKACLGNLFFSPFSVSTCLGMALLGARENTALQMARCLRFRAEKGETHRGLAALQKMLLADGGRANMELRIANTLWGHRKFPVLPAFLDTVDRYYRGAFQEVDFANSGEACQLINHWVEQTTNALIKEIVTEGQISNALLVLANAIYFRGKWSTPFEKEATKLRPFYLASGTAAEVPMMSQLTAGWYAKVQGLQILEKWYGEGEFSMVILLPERSDGVEALEATLNPPNLDAWLARLEPEDEVDIQLPKFRIESDYDLRDRLIEMGMVDAFDPQAAEFSGMTGKKDLFVGSVIHKAVVDVEEEGTEAAAATAFTFFWGDIVNAKRPAVFHVDRPFIFLIRHNPSRTLLFLGRVMDPR